MDVLITSNGLAGLHEHKLFSRPEDIPFTQTEVLGFGGIAVVDEVRGISGRFRGQIYARKTILLHNPRDREAALGEIEKEVNILKLLHHGHIHIVQLIMTYQLRNTYAIIMDPRADGNLDGYLTGDATDAHEKTQHWFKCLISAVAYVHERNIRHRDIKPQNILVKGADVLLTDFGISLMGLGKTVPTTRVGGPRSRTIEYCAPEVENGHTRGRSADIFSLGAVFLEMLTACTHPGKLEVFRATLNVGGRQSYAMSLDMISQWMDTFQHMPDIVSWHTSILLLCQKMLLANRDRRPLAGDLRAWWLHQTASDLPHGECSCSLAPLSFEKYTDHDIDENLRQAYANGHRLMVDLWHKRGAKLGSDKDLIAASEGGLWDHVEHLLKAKLDTTTDSAFQGSSAGGIESTMEVLLKNNALQGASAGGFYELVETLLDHGADINGKDDDGRTALHAAASRGHKDVVRMLLQRGADVESHDNNAETAVQLAVINRHEEVAQLLQGDPAKGSASPV